MNKPVYLDLSILELVKHSCMSFGMIILKHQYKASIQCKTILHGYRELYYSY